MPLVLLLVTPSSEEHAETSAIAAKPKAAKFRSNPNDVTRRLFMQTLLTDREKDWGGLDRSDCERLRPTCRTLLLPFAFVNRSGIAFFTMANQPFRPRVQCGAKIRIA